MKIGILGASNSLIVGGWHSVLAGFYDVEKHAVGGSNSGIGIYKAVEKDLIQRMDAVFINFGVSEHEELELGFVTPEHMKTLISSLYSLFECSSTHCISIVFPIMDHAMAGGRDLSFKYHEEFSSSASGLVIDGYDFIGKILEHNNMINVKNLFNDRHHLHPIVSRYIGHIAKEVAHLIGSCEKIVSRDSAECERAWYVHGHESQLFENLPSKNVINSNFSEIPNSLGCSDTIEFDSLDVIHGLYIDASNSHSKIRISSGSSTVVKNLYCKDDIIKEGSPQFIFCSLLNEFHCQGKTTISLVTDCETVTEGQRGEKSLPALRLSGGGYHERSAVICGILMSKHGGLAQKKFTLPFISELKSNVDKIVSYYAQEAAETLGLFLVKTPMSNGGELEKLAAESIESIIVQEAGLIDEEDYLSNNQDVRNSGMGAVEHYCRHGYIEGRIPRTGFDPLEYALTNGIDKSVNPLYHAAVKHLNGASKALLLSPPDTNQSERLFSIEHRLIERSGLLDSAYYYESNPDVEAAHIDAISHYCRHGFRELRNPSFSFDGAKYSEEKGLREYENPLVHFILNP